MGGFSIERSKAMSYEKVTLGDVVQDRLTNCRGVVVEIAPGGAWVEMDSHDIDPNDDSRWYLPDGRLIRL
jgi:heat shock protein HspQ